MSSNFALTGWAGLGVLVWWLYGGCIVAVWWFYESGHSFASPSPHLRYEPGQWVEKIFFIAYAIMKGHARL